MRAVCKVIIAAAVLLLSATLSAGCGHAPVKLYPGAVSGSGRSVPEWIMSPQDIPCARGETCVVGVSRCAPDGPVALDASRMSGYARLASMAFPVEVAGVWKDFQTVELSGGSEKSRTVISDDVRTELGGRVTGARVVEEYWARRRVHSIGGASDCYDGWSLIAISTAELESLYPRELERSKSEVVRLARELKPVEEAMKAEDSAFLDSIPLAISVFRGAESVLAGLQSVEGLAGLRGRLAAAESQLGARIAIFLVDVGFNGDGTASATLGAAAVGRNLAGLDLMVDGCGQQERAVVTDAGGRAVVPVSSSSPFSQCSLGVRISGIRGFTSSVQVPPAFSGSTVSVSASVDGYLADRLERFAASSAKVEAGRLSRPRAAGGRPMLDFTLSVSISTRPPVPYNGRVSLVSSTIDITLVGYAEGRQAVSLSYGRRDLRALGLDQSQMATALETQIGQAVSGAVASFADSTGASSSR